MKVVLNLIWLALAGVWLAVGYVLAGLVNVVFIITIPFAIQSFKLAGYALWPFGRVVVQRPGADAALSLLGNVIWFITAGIWLALAHVLTALVLMITIIGIPLGVANLKMAGLALAPFGKQIVSERNLPTGAIVQVDFPEG